MCGVQGILVLLATLIRYPYEVREEKEYFDEIKDVKVTSRQAADGCWHRPLRPSRPRLSASSFSIWAFSRASINSPSSFTGLAGIDSASRRGRGS